MADLEHLETPLAPPGPRSTEHWTLPKTVRIECDGVSPEKTRILDDATGEPIGARVHGMTFTAEAGIPNRLEIVLAEVALRATVHHVAFDISEEDLRELARQNGFEIAAVPVYGARIEPYGPAEHKFLVRDLPGWQVIAPGARPTHASLEYAGAALREHLVDLGHLNEPIPAPSDLQDGEFELMAHHARG